MSEVPSSRRPTTTSSSSYFIYMPWPWSEHEDQYRLWWNHEQALATENGVEYLSPPQEERFSFDEGSRAAHPPVANGGHGAADEPLPRHDDAARAHRHESIQRTAS